MEFNPLQVNTYTIQELADFITSSKATKDVIYACGLSATKRPDLEAELTKRQMQIVEDDENWQVSKRKDTISAYEYYLRKYDKFSPEYRGKYVAEAKMRIEELEEETKRLRAELFNRMREKPWEFKQDGMKMLFEGVDDDKTLEGFRNRSDVVSRFIASGRTISYKDLLDEGIIPSNITKENIIAPDHNLVQTNINQLGEFPEERRTDVYFFGVPRGGKSSVLAGIISCMNKAGVAVYQPHYNNENRDLVKPYYNGLILSTKQGKFPVSTGTDSISFLKLDLQINNRSNKLTFVEIGGEAFKNAVDTGLKGALAWDGLGAGSCLKVNNKKLLIFILDYGLSKGVNNASSEFQQANILDTALDILSNDGTGKDGSNGCTLSKVDTVAIVVTKSDLMNVRRDDRNKEANKYIRETFATFMLKLKRKCEKFGINKPVEHKPYIMAFSLGKMLIGNTYAFDPKDSKAIVEFISDVTEGRGTGWWGRVLGNL